MRLSISSGKKSDGTMESNTENIFLMASTVKGEGGSGGEIVQGIICFVGFAEKCMREKKKVLCYCLFIYK